MIENSLYERVGIQALGYVMDILTDEQRPSDLSGATLDRSLESLEPVAAWTSDWKLAPICSHRGG